MTIAVPVEDTPSVLHHPLAQEGPGTTFHLLNQYFSTIDTAGERLFLAESKPDPQERAVVQRLCNIFHRTIAFEQANLAPEQRPNQGVWEMMRHEFHGEAYRMLHENDVEGLAAHLRNGLRRRVSTGLGPGADVFRTFVSQPDTQRLHVVLIRDRLVSLAVALDVLAHENPEQGRYGEHMQQPTHDLVQRIQAKLGTEIWRPPVMGLFGLDFDGNVVDIRAAEDAYCAHRLSTMLPDYKTKIVAEIGAGFGGLLMQSVRMGFRRALAFDLPLISLLQGYFLIMIFGPDMVRLYGEADADRPIQLMPYWEFADPGHAFDIVVNRDSLPEMPPQAAIGYLREIERRGVPFLSINQETQAASGQQDVQQLHIGRMAASYTGLQRTSRSLYWLRRGYIEETYGPAPA